MSTKKVTSTDQKIANRKNIYQYIYDNHASSKMSIAYALQLSLPTITQGLSILEDAGLIIKNGTFESSGGRKAQMYCCNPTARIAIGTEMLTDAFHIVATDLYGNTFQSVTKNLNFEDKEEYYQMLAEEINAFISSLHVKDEQILGIGIALQSLTSQDEKNAVFAPLLRTNNISYTHFSRYLNYPVSIIHDAKAAAFAEQWFQKVTDAIYIGLNHHLGCAIIVNGAIYYGLKNMAGSLEHLVIVPKGQPCYCGKNGCAEQYCSGVSIETNYGKPIERFFSDLRNEKKEATALWNKYLTSLGALIDNCRIITDGPVIVGGTIASLMTEQDLQIIQKSIPAIEAFELDLRKGKCEEHPSAVGAALLHIQSFLDHLPLV